MPRTSCPPALAAPIAGLLFLSLAVPSAHAISRRTLIAPTGTATSDQLGYSVSGAGDVNGDGYDDVIVGAPLNDAGGVDAGRAFVYFGGPGADETPDLTLTGAAAGDNFGISVGAAGDVNGDGYDDVIVGASLVGAGSGRAYVFFGGAVPNANADLTLFGAGGEALGYSVGTAGDVNGDGYDDVIVGAPLNDVVGVDAGRAYVYYGGAAPNSVADLTLSGSAAGDQFGISVATAGDMNGDGHADVIVGASGNDTAAANAGQAYVYFGGPGADAAADLTLSGSAANDNFGFSVATAGDVNGDGYADVIVGAPYNGAGGRAYVYFGGGTIDATADLLLTGVSGDLVGWSVHGAGDVNADGYDDVIAGAPLNDAGGANAGAAIVYFGGAAPNSTADLYVLGLSPGDQMGFSVGAAGDVNGDGFDDVVAGAPVSNVSGLTTGQAVVTLIYPYAVLSPNGGEQWVGGRSATVRWLGQDPADIAISTDGGATYTALVNGVGGDDDNSVTLVAPYVATSAARVRVSQRGVTVTNSVSDASDAVFSIVLPVDPPAAAARLALAPDGGAGSQQFGYSVGTAGDVNGDGYADAIVGARFNDAGGTDAGRAYVYFGGPGADAVSDWTLTGEAAGDLFGSYVGTAGDVNGDGYDDAIVGAPQNDVGGSNAGRAYVYYGGPGADAVPDITLTGEAAGDQFGYSAATAGDFNGDGYADVIVGAYLNDAGGLSAGRAYVYLGGPGADAIADLTLTGAAASDRFGTSVATAGDVNGDGYDDVIVGAPFNSAGGVTSGRAYVFFGGLNADATADLLLTGEASSDLFGTGVGTAGDVNGDGYDDVIAGAPLNDAGGASAGRAYVFFGGTAADATADLTLTGEAADGELGYAVGPAGDVNGDGFADVIVGAFILSLDAANAGRAYVYFGGPAPDAIADATLADGTNSSYLGYAVGTAGDMSGDGFDDVIVGGPLDDTGGTDAGRAYVYDFNRYFVTSPNDDEVWNVGAAQTVTWLGAEPADLWLSTNGGATYELLRHDVGGDAANALNLLVPHTPTKFARVKVTPADPSITGADESDSTFTIQSSVALLSLVAELEPEGGARVKWSSEPGVGPAGLAGYRVYRIAAGAAGNGTRIGPELIAETEYVDAGGGAGTGYRVTAVNGLMEELELGRVMVGSASPLAAWPVPYRSGEMRIAFATYGGLGGGRGAASVELFDVGGRLVRTIARGSFAAGSQTATWDGTDGDGRRVGPGIYFLRLKSAADERRIKVVVAR